MLGANFVIFATFLHAGKTLTTSRIVSPTKCIIWFLGAVIFLLGLGVAFTGYVVVSGNMSYWAALVILNLASVIPFLGDEVVAGILASSTVTSWAIRRFTVLHFLLGIIAILFVLIHIVILHRQNPSLHQTDIADGSETLLQVLVKDFAVFLLVFSFVFLDASKSFVHPDNWQAFSRLLTPAHIEPEIYFLWTFSCVKLHNGKLAGWETWSWQFLCSRNFVLNSFCTSTSDTVHRDSFVNFCQSVLFC
jgi:quinol-cytochrome oxidoreductase complex cytochrome b subunit